MRIYYQKLILHALLPVVLALFCVAFWSCYYKGCNRTQEFMYHGRMLASLIIVLFLVHPSIVMYMFDNFNCADIDGEKRVYSDMEILCN